MVRLALLTLLAAAACAVAAAPAFAAAPSVTTGGATDRTPQSATVHGSVNPNGRPTSYYFQFGTTTRYGTRTNTGDAGSGRTRVQVSAALTGLRPNTTYHYRLVAFSTGGTTRGSDRTFKTPQLPTNVSIAVTPNPSVAGSTIAISGALTGPDVGGKQVALEVKAFPFIDGFVQYGNTLLTGADGRYTFIVPAFVNFYARVAERSRPRAVSPVVPAFVALKVGFKARKLHRSRRGGRIVRFSGTVAPPRNGNAVLIQRRTHHRWRTVGLTLTHARSTGVGRFSKRLRLRSSGKFRARVRTAGGDYVDGTSRSVRVKIRRR